ncbi:MAG: beta-N-acetylhexosaminidase [Giesbergeria sp.]
MTTHAPLLIDVAGLELTGADRRRLAHPLVGGIILFARNWSSRAQLLDLTAAIKAVRGDLLISVDHEGGRVQRFRSDGFTQLPPMRAFGELWMRDGKAGAGSGAMRAQDAATAAGYVLASELRSCGVDFSFTPVLDLDWQTDAGASRSGVIGNRAFHPDARVVGTLARALMLGLLQAGMGNCGKHFPGHGFVTADSHLELPVDRRSLSAILQDDAAPYGWLTSALTAVMPAHVVYARVDARPACFSKHWITDILRTRLGFEGAVISDDLSMEGARRLDGRVVSHTAAAQAALDAGCDLVLLCNQSVGEGRAVDGLLDGLSALQQQGAWVPHAEGEARRQALLPQTLPLPWDELMFDARYLRALEMLP